MSLSRDPYPGVPIGPPDTMPQRFAKVIGYRLVAPPPGVWCKPEPFAMGWRGWVSAGVLAIVFWPLSCLPCCMTCSYSPYQVPVYETS
jgi:hypothetical protein